MKTLWITWEEHRRTRELAAALDVTLVELASDASRLRRYATLLRTTWQILRRERPDVLIVQSPSVVLTAFAVAVGRRYAGRVVVDAHNDGVRPFDRRLDFLLPLYRLLQRRSDLTVVTNAALAEQVTRHGGRAFVLADRIPKLEPERRTPLRGSHNLVLICTYEKDEPFAAVVEAARRLDPSICFYITGRVSKAPPELVARAPDNVVFTDFLDEVDYVSLLGSCDVVMDLTLMEDCLVCGAYEALSLGKPMILSDTAALRDYFSQGVIYTANDPEALVRAVREALERREQLARDAQALRQRLQSSWELQCQRLRYYLA